MRTARSSPANLRRRLEALEKSLSLTDQVCAQMIHTVCYSMGKNELESLIDALLAHLRGRELTDREAAAKQAYAAALKSECRCRGLVVYRLPDVSDVSSMIFQAATRGWCAQDVTLLLGILTPCYRALSQPWNSTRPRKPPSPPTRQNIGRVDLALIRALTP